MISLALLAALCAHSSLPADASFEPVVSTYSPAASLASAAAQAPDYGGDPGTPLGDLHGREAHWFRKCKPAVIYGGSRPTVEFCGPCVPEPAPIGACTGEDGSAVAIFEPGDCVLGAAICVSMTLYVERNTYEFVSKRDKPCGTRSLQGSASAGLQSGSGGGPSYGAQFTYGSVTNESTTCCLYALTNEVSGFHIPNCD